MPGTLQPLDGKFAIVDANGNPTEYFTRWAQQRQIDIGDGITLAQAQQAISDWAAARQIIAGRALDGGGFLSADVTIGHAESLVVPGTYGDATHVPQFVVDQEGHIQGVVPVPISGGGGGAISLIASQTLAAAAASITFTGIPNTYNDLILVGQARSTKAATSDDIRCQVNGDTAANYDYERENRFGVGDGNGVAFMECTSIAGNTAPANVADTFELLFPNYAVTTFHKMMRSYGEVMVSAAAGGIFRTICSGRWRNTAAINQITVLSPASTLAIGSNFRLYGRL